VSEPALPHIAIAGAGTVGCYIGGRLQGHARVTMIGRSRLAAAVSAHGLHLSDWQGYQRHVDPAAVIFRTDIGAAADADLVLVTVKSGATAEIARGLATALIRPTLVVSLQNGLRNADILRQHLPRHHVLAGVVPFNVVQRLPATFHQSSSGALMVQADAQLIPFLEIFRAAGLALYQRNDMPAVQLAKLLLNLNNAINALSDLPLREQLSQRAWRRCLALAQHEALRIFAVAGMHPARLTPLPARWLPAVLNLPDRWFQLLAARLLAIDPLARSSTWEDLQAGRRTEVDAIQGEVIALATAHGGSAPVNARLLVLVREAEKRRVHFTSEQLLAILRDAASGERPCEPVHKQGVPGPPAPK
jgi:2-dehydropantoate 2-reductase